MDRLPFRIIGHERAEADRAYSMGLITYQELKAVLRANC